MSPYPYVTRRTIGVVLTGIFRQHARAQASPAYVLHIPIQPASSQVVANYARALVGRACRQEVRPTHILFDCSLIRGHDEATLRVLLGAIRLACENGVDVIVAGGDEALRVMLEARRLPVLIVAGEYASDAPSRARTGA